MGSPDDCDAECMARRKSKSGAVATCDAMTAALAIRLRPAASFHEKLRQLVGKCETKRGPQAGAFSCPGYAAFAANSNEAISASL
jgi:hypothetical protein